MFGMGTGVALSLWSPGKKQLNDRVAFATKDLNRFLAYERNKVKPHDRLVLVS